MEARAQLDQRGDTAGRGDAARRWMRDAGQEPENRRLAGPVRTDDAENVTSYNFV